MLDADTTFEFTRDFITVAQAHNERPDPPEYK